VKIAALQFTTAARDPEFCEAFDPEDLTTTIRETMGEAMKEAALFAAAHRVPAWRGLATH
jgi:hypothetical protein